MTFIERQIGLLALAIFGMILIRVFMITDANALKLDGYENGFMQYRSWFGSSLGEQSDLAQKIALTLQRKRSAPVEPLADQEIITGSTSAPTEKKPQAEATDKSMGVQKPQPSASAETDKAGEAKTAPEKPPAASPGLITAPLAPAPQGDAERSLLERLGLRRSELDKREEDLANREALLQAAEKRLAERSEELKKLEADLKARTDQRNAELQSLKPVVTIYETMKPKDAARVFEKIEFANLLLVAGAMNPRKLSDILAQMDPALAGKLTKSMSAAGRSAVLPQPVAKAENGMELPDFNPQGTP